jgi:hypothetical protein
MAKQAKPTSPLFQASIDDQMERLSGVSGATMDIFAQSCRAYVSGLAAMNAELMGFINTRLNHDAEFNAALAKCNNWTQAAGMQQEWLQQAAREYIAESGRLMEVATKVANETWTPVQERASQALHDL